MDFSATQGPEVTPSTVTRHHATPAIAAKASEARVRRRTYGPALENEGERTLFQGFEPVSSCGLVRCLSHGFPTILNRWHYHPEYELHLIVATHGRAYVGDYIGNYEPGHLVLTGPGVPHNWLVDDLPPGGISAHIHKVLQFHDEPLREVAKVMDAVQDIFPMLERARLGIEFFGIADLAERRFEDIRQSTGLKRVSHFLAYLAELAETADYRLLSEAPVQGAADDDTLEAAEIIQYVADNALDDISLALVAQRFGMSPKYFSKHFKRATGNTFVDFVLRLRINQACRLLAESQMYISTICDRVGFNNVANFNRHFLKIKGMTPTQFRQRSSEKFGAGYKLT